MAALRRAAELSMALIYMDKDDVNNARRLINSGADVNFVARKMNGEEELDTTPLIQAATSGHANVLSILIEKGAAVNKRAPSNGYTALHAAAEYGHREIAICLLDHGAIVNAQDIEGFTPLLNAAQEGHLPLVKLLIIRGADLNLANTEGSTPLHLAVIDGYLEKAKLLVEKGAVVDRLAKHGGRAIFNASIYGHLDVVEYLISAGANINHMKHSIPCSLLLRQVTLILSGFFCAGELISTRSSIKREIDIQPFTSLLQEAMLL